MNTIKAIETTYKGYRFRSRLEARWAVFFDALRIKWEYEPEGYVLEDGTRYLPDFWLPKLGGGMFAEVKPQALTLDETRKVALLCKMTGNQVIAAVGTPDARVYEVYRYSEDGGISVCDASFVAKYLPGGANANEYRLFGCPGYENADGSIDKDFVDCSVWAAINYARAARFEHGECGVRS